MPGRDAARTAVAVLAAAGALSMSALLTGPLPAQAHGLAQPVPDAAYYRAAITSAPPSTSGVAVRVDPRAEWIEVTALTREPVVVLGYLKEPYLRISAAGVEENQLSQSALLNKSLFGDPLPAAAGVTAAAPAWKRTSTRTVARWHDHRIHWMGADRPPVVAADPTHPHRVGSWTVHLLVGRAPVNVAGELRWIGKPAPPAQLFTPLRVILLNGVLAAVIGAVALLRRRRVTRTA